MEVEKTFGFIALACFVLALFIFLVARISAYFSNSGNTTVHIDEAECSIANPTAEILWLNTVKALFENNEALDYRDILVKCGVPEEVAFSGDGKEIMNYKPFIKGSDNEAIFNVYSLAVSDRYWLQKAPLQVIDPSQYNLNLHDGEILYISINLTTLYEEKVTQRNIAYSGMRWNNGLLRAGTLSMVSNEIRNFVPQDCGRIFITDRRIIFIGKQRNITKVVSLKNIITYTLYQDGVIINQPNKKVLLFKFESYNDDTILIQDGLNQFVTVLSRILDGKEKEDYTKDGQLKKELISKGYDEYLYKISYWAIGKDKITMSQIMRSHEVSSYRACEILEQLALIGIIDKPYDSNVIVNEAGLLKEKLYNAPINKQEQNE